MTIPRALKTIVGCTVVGGVIGTTLGYSIGRFLPDAYRSLFEGGHDPNFAPVAVGIDLGLSQGLMLGALVGIAATLIVT